MIVEASEIEFRGSFEKLRYTSYSKEQFSYDTEEKRKWIVIATERKFPKKNFFSTEKMKLIIDNLEHRTYTTFRFAGKTLHRFKQWRSTSFKFDVNEIT